MSAPIPLLSVRELSKTYVARHSPSAARSADVIAVDHVSFDLHRSQILGLAGGSGSGKSTLARCLVHLVAADSGEIVVDGTPVTFGRRSELRDHRRRIQMVFQDPYSSLNPRFSVGNAILEAGRVHRRPGSENAATFVGDLLDLVQLPRELAQRKPRELSGGQLQRAAIARALAVGPDVLIADESVSALDVSVQAQLLRLFRELSHETGIGMIFVTHQLAVLAEVADDILVMNNGRIVESGTASTVLTRPVDSYTRQLLAAHPSIDPDRSLFP
jgi:ABC-type glutathione transport system ATPase component